MKVKLSLLVFLLLFASLQLDAQKLRNINLKVVLNDSIANDTVASPGRLFVTSYIINQGPDSVFHSDRMFSKYKFGNSIYTVTFPYFNKNMGVGDTFVHTKNLDLYYTVNVNDIEVCAFFRMSTPIRDSIPPESKNDLKDNWGCLPIHHKSNYPTKNIDIASLNGVKIYPNPASESFQIEGSNITKLALVNLLGKRIGLKYEKSQNIIRLDVSSLSKGVYILHYIQKGKAYSEKISIVD